MSAAPSSSSGTLVWRCEVCREPVIDGEGYLELPFAELQQRREEDAKWKKAHPDGEPVRISELMTLPDRARWRVLHLQCDLDQADSYWIDTARCRTLKALVDWTAHLLEKEWLQSTNWADVLRLQVRAGE